MKFEGEVWKDTKSKHWVANVPLLNISTQGNSYKNVLEMIKDAIEIEVNKPGFYIEVEAFRESHTFTISASDIDILIAFMLKRQRQANGLTLLEVARRMHAKSTNAYAQYERGSRHPTISVLLNLLHAIDPSLMPIMKANHP